MKIRLNTDCHPCRKLSRTSTLCNEPRCLRRIPPPSPLLSPSTGLLSHIKSSTVTIDAKYKVSQRANSNPTMSSKITAVTSSSHFSKLLSQSNYTVVDFYADWCGPCKAIAPVFAQLAEKESKPGKVQFVKVDVDSQQDVARQYGVSA